MAKAIQQPSEGRDGPTDADVLYDLPEDDVFIGLGEGICPTATTFSTGCWTIWRRIWARGRRGRLGDGNQIITVPVQCQSRRRGGDEPV